MNSSYTVFLCGGKWQLPWFTFLKNKGHKIILVDPYDYSPCVVLADIFLKEDVRNTENIISFLKDNNFVIEMVTSEQTDVSVLPASIISKEMGLENNFPKVVEIFTNKGISRSFFKQKFGNHIPDFQLVESKDELLIFLKNNGSIIIKPVDSQSSRGVHKLDVKNSISEIDVAFEDCLTYSFEKKIIAEQFIRGNEITLEGIALFKKHYTITGSNKKHFRTGIASDLSYPLSINRSLETKLIEFHNNLVESTGINTAITHAEYLVNEDEGSFYLVEVACRGGGSLIPSHIVPFVTNIKLYEIYYDALYNRKVNFNFNIDSIKSMTLHFFEFPSGRVISIEGFEECSKYNFVLAIGLEFVVGNIIKNASDDRSRQGYVLVGGKTDEDVLKNIEIIYNTLKIKYE